MEASNAPTGPIPLIRTFLPYFSTYRAWVWGDLEGLWNGDEREIKDSEVKYILEYKAHVVSEEGS